MIDKFNFYDVYGYLMPGTALLVLAWLPFGILSRKLPTADWGSAVVFLIAAYLVGHVLHAITDSALSAMQVKNKGDQPRFPSSIVLDPKDDGLHLPLHLEPLSSALQADLQNYLKTPPPGLDLKIGQSVDAERGSAFFLCRSVLIQRKVGSYAEQYEGMYALTRSLTVAFGLGSFYLAGWVASLGNSDFFRCVLLLCLPMLLAAAILTSMTRAAARGDVAATLPWGRATLAMLVLAAFCAGGLLGSRCGVSGGQSFLFLVMVLLAALSAVKCFRAYEAFAGAFAKAVWTDFVCYQKFPPKDSSKDA